MPAPRTLLQLAGVTLAPPTPAGSALVLIDAQRFYAEGPLALPGIDAALHALEAALARARAAGVPVLHVVHHGKPGSMFDPAAPSTAILEAARPAAGEPLIVKGMPSAFTATELEAALRRLGVTTPVFAGFMTHMCVSSAARAAVELGFRPWVLADACAARALPDGAGGVLEADVVHRAHLASLADRFAGILRAAELFAAPAAGVAR